MFTKKTIKDINVKDQIVLVRTDYNVPLEDGQVTSDLRICASLPTINYLLEHHAKKIILVSHLGRPDGAKNPAMSLQPVADCLAKLLPGRTIKFVNDVSGPEVEEAAETLPDGGILLLENLRFSPAEEKNSEEYAREIVDSVHADLFVQDGFAVIHRAHASTDAITHLLPSVAGLLLEKEITALSKVLNNPARPLTLVLGGAKVADKEPLIDKFLGLADHICIGGKIAAEMVESPDAKIYVAEDFDTDNDGNKLDIGPLSTAKITDIIKESKTVIWNGLMGKAEDPAYDAGSTAIAEVLGNSPEIFSVICGGDTSGFVENLIKSQPDLKFSLISTGGGASLEFLCGKTLPGLDSLEDA